MRTIDRIQILQGVKLEASVPRGGEEGIVGVEVAELFGGAGGEDGGKGGAKEGVEVREAGGAGVFGGRYAD